MQECYYLKGVMIQSVIYRSRESRPAESTFHPTSSPVFQIIVAKVAIFVLIFLLGEILPQLVAAMVVSIGSGL